MSGKALELENSSPRKRLEENKDISVEITRTSADRKDARKSSSSVLFYISSMGWMKFFTFVSLVTVEVVTNAMQGKSQFSLSRL
jgi:hypothetical protein